MPTLALPDANILYPRVLRDWLLLLKDTSRGEMFRVAYTEDVLAEAIYHIRRNNPHLNGHQMSRIHDQIQGTMDLRIDDYPSGQDASFISDTFDRHLHAAAVAGGAACIITNDTDFTRLPQDVRDDLEYEIYTADEFFMLVDDSSPGLVLATLKRQIAHRSTRPDASSYNFSQSLEKAECPEFAMRVRDHCRALARQ